MTRDAPRAGLLTPAAERRAAIEREVDAWFRAMVNDFAHRMTHTEKQTRCDHCERDLHDRLSLLVEQMVGEEREACAKVIEALAPTEQEASRIARGYNPDRYKRNLLLDGASAIRARATGGG